MEQATETIATPLNERMNWTEVKAWRREARRKLLAARAGNDDGGARGSLAPADRTAGATLEGPAAPISFYWPIKAEPDLKPLMRELDEAGIDVCLPVCIQRGEPLAFRRWTKGAKMERGFWDIPVPADPTEVQPRTLIAPIVGYDGAGYRLGYGGGFFDRTLAKFGGAAEAIGIGFSLFRLDTIHPQPHDMRMARIVTEAGMVAAGTSSASAVCYLDESDPTYAGYDTPAEVAQKLAGIAAQLPPGTPRPARLRAVAAGRGGGGTGRAGGFRTGGARPSVAADPR